jgi:seryl-tRNA synthetase
MAPPALALDSLARASYFASFPQWLTLAAHLRDDAATLERVAESADPAAAARAAAAPADAVLPPAMCYHVYAALAGRVLSTPVTVTVQGTCWRHEGEALRPLARGWAFTMREGVCIGDAEAVAAFRARGIDRGLALAAALGLEARLEEATDPFFAPTARGSSRSCGFPSGTRASRLRPSTSTSASSARRSTSGCPMARLRPAGASPTGSIAGSSPSWPRTA